MQWMVCRAACQVGVLSHAARIVRPQLQAAVRWQQHLVIRSGREWVMPLWFFTTALLRMVELQRMLRDAGRCSLGWASL
jgi:hypothetical protein